MLHEERNARIIEALERSRVRDTASKEAAIAALVRLGLLLPNGEPHPDFAPAADDEAQD